MSKCSVYSKSQAEIHFDGVNVQFKGPLSLYDRMMNFKADYGSSPLNWPLIQKVETASDILINEWLNKLNGIETARYTDEELCHCRRVKTENVISAIKQGCSTVIEVGKATRAGTNCGSCHENIKSLIEDFNWKKSGS